VTKAEFIDMVADRSGLTKRDATKAVDAFLESITAALQSGDAVSFTGFGKFSPQQRAARWRARADPCGHGSQVLRREPAQGRAQALGVTQQRVFGGGCTGGPRFRLHRRRPT
jgi:hypothetical protein